MRASAADSGSGGSGGICAVVGGGVTVGGGGVAARFGCAGGASSSGGGAGASVGPLGGVGAAEAGGEVERDEAATERAAERGDGGPSARSTAAVTVAQPSIAPSAERHGAGPSDEYDGCRLSMGEAGGC